MKSFLFKTTMFVIITAVLYIPFIFILSNVFSTFLNQSFYNSGYTSNRLQDADKIKNIDVVFLGSSHAYRGFDPKKFSFSSFNLGTTAQTPIQSYILIKKHLKQMKPKLIIYEVYPETFEISGLESQLDLLSNSPINTDIISTTFEFNNTKAFNLLILNFLNHKLLKKPFLKQGRNSSERYYSNGYVESEKQTFLPIAINNGKWTPLKNQLQYFKKCLNFLKQNKTKVLLVFAPITKIEYNSYENIEDFNNLMKQIHKYVNFNKTLVDSLHFYDSHHLNKAGVNIFNKQLQDYISKNEILTPR